ncbi:hypothetical protein MHLP_03760 [Candidatus Mycoplasma haematolamae str. Purdue]|uniref:Uncharacterized protein n=1 Tax=Mycoplasma haematolamae (strain Purdue) TaxID=1212765 RepID=I7C700_MYCHA|nr:hypothetical protein [Candidatus Mycoplasma haematolamae]AFO52332.1 hypothetical protein MHLP_03760 [Candidatus Mycoplasma haematolamae str. Purdue]
MTLTSIWLKGLSQQGKIYLATSSLALGAGVTGSLAVDSTRGSIWQGVSYVGSSISGFLGKAVEASSAPPRPGNSSDQSVNEIFVTAWDGLALLVSSGAKWAWSSLVYAGSKLTVLKETYGVVKGWAANVYSFLKENYEALWVFIKNSFTFIDLEKIYGLLTDNSKTSKVVEVIKKEGQGGWKSMMSDLKDIADKAKTIPFNSSKAFQKIMKKLMEKPDDMSITGTRLSILKGFVSNQQQNNKDQINSLIDFFAKEDQEIKDFKWTWFTDTKKK